MPVGFAASGRIGLALFGLINAGVKDDGEQDPDAQCDEHYVLSSHTGNEWISKQDAWNTLRKYPKFVGIFGSNDAILSSRDAQNHPGHHIDRDIGGHGEGVSMATEGEEKKNIY